MLIPEALEIVTNIIMNIKNNSLHHRYKKFHFQRSEILIILYVEYKHNLTSMDTKIVSIISWNAFLSQICAKNWPLVSHASVEHVREVHIDETVSLAHLTGARGVCDKHLGKHWAKLICRRRSPLCCCGHVAMNKWWLSKQRERAEDDDSLHVREARRDESARLYLTSHLRRLAQPITAAAAAALHCTVCLLETQITIINLSIWHGLSHNSFIRAARLRSPLCAERASESEGKGLFVFGWLRAETELSKRAHTQHLIPFYLLSSRLLF